MSLVRSDREIECSSFADHWLNWNRSTKTFADLMTDEQTNSIPMRVEISTKHVLRAPIELEDVFHFPWR